mmetsp:Transcript_7307/g.20709  ORF Transcript_7307/g.20709 Transcript_7307/m.20709 type:complete len:378 (+) Transcript_7307:1632-2765(+)
MHEGRLRCVLRPEGQMRHLPRHLPRAQDPAARRGRRHVQRLRLRAGRRQSVLSEHFQLRQLQRQLPSQDGGTAGRRGSAVRAGRVHRGGRPGGVLPGDVRAVRPRYVPRQRGRAARRRLHLQQRPGGQVLRPRVLPPAREVFHLRVRLPHWNHPAARRSQRRVRDGCVPAGGRGRVLPATPDLQRNADARLPAPHGSRAHAAQRAVCHGSLWHAHERQAVVLHGCGELRGVRQFHVPSPARHQDESREPGLCWGVLRAGGPGLLLRARGALHDPGLPGPGAPRGAQRHVHGVRVHGAGSRAVLRREAQLLRVQLLLRAGHVAGIPRGRAQVQRLRLPPRRHLPVLRGARELQDVPGVVPRRLQHLRAGAMPAGEMYR